MWLSFILCFVIQKHSPCALRLLSAANADFVLVYLTPIKNIHLVMSDTLISCNYLYRGHCAHRVRTRIYFVENSEVAKRQISMNLTYKKVQGFTQDQYWQSCAQHGTQTWRCLKLLTCDQQVERASPLDSGEARLRDLKDELYNSQRPHKSSIHQCIGQAGHSLKLVNYSNRKHWNRIWGKILCHTCPSLHTRHEVRCAGKTEYSFPVFSA